MHGSRPIYLVLILAFFCAFAGVMNAKLVVWMGKPLVEGTGNLIIVNPLLMVLLRQINSPVHSDEVVRYKKQMLGKHSLFV